MGRRRVAAIVGAFLATLPAAAVAAEPRAYPSADGSTLAGERLIWVERGSNSVRAQDLAGGTPRTLYRPQLVGGADSLELLRLAASASRIAFVTEGFEELANGDTDALAWMTIRSGPVEGPYPVVAGREDRSGDLVLFDDVEVYDGGVVYVSSNGRGDSQVVVRPDSGPARVLLRHRGFLGLAASGGVVAVRFGEEERRHVEVFDVATGQPLFGLNVPPGPDIAVAPDGTLLVLADRILSWASPPAPVLHEIARSATNIAGVAGGTAVFSATKRNGFGVVRTADLATGATRDVTPPAITLLAGEWDGANFSYYNGSCFVAGELPAAAPAMAPTARGCPREPMATSAHVSRRRGTIRLTARCPGGAADHCTGAATIRGRIASRRRTLASLSFDLTGGGVARFKLAADPGLLRRVGSRADRRRGRHAVRLEIRMSEGRVDQRVRPFTFRS